MDNGGVADLSYPSSKLRRGRVQGDGWICPALTCQSGVHQINRSEKKKDGEKEEEEMTEYEYRIRRLTPSECFVLMGLTKEDVEKAKKMGLSESALYKQAGNGIVTNCVELLGEHLYKAQEDETFVCSDEEK